MISVVVVALLALVLVAFVAVPLIAPTQADPLPDERDPVVEELREEKDALLRAIRELDGRDDLPEARRAELHARYEAKAAATLHALDEAEAARDGRGPRTPSRRRVPVAALSLLALAGIAAVALSGWVLPRVGDGTTVTTSTGTDLARAQELRDLQRAVDASPTPEALLALADAYWNADDVENAQDVYQRIVDEVDDPPALALRRLALLVLPRASGDGPEGIVTARGLLDRARAIDPRDPDTLATLGEVAYAQGDYLAALDAWRTYQDAAPEGDPLADRAAQRVTVLSAVAPAAQAYDEEQTKATTIALADALWSAEELQRALSLYFDVLTKFDPTDLHATERTGEALFLAGRAADGAQILARATELAAAQGVEASPRTWLFLGNARTTLGDDAGAIQAWQRYLDVTDAPGRVPDLIDAARERIANGTSGAASPSTQTASAMGASIYRQNCAICHGVAGEGGTGLALSGNRRANDAANVADSVRWGRGLMPGFGARLSDGEIAAVVDYVVGTFGVGPSGEPRP